MARAARATRRSSAAATPLGGDVIAIRLVVEPAARPRLRSAAASVVLAGAGTRQSRSCWTIVAADARPCSELRVQLAEAARVRIRERVPIGRTEEREGFWSGPRSADHLGRPLLRHRVELGLGSVADDCWAHRWRASANYASPNRRTTPPA